MTASPGSSHVAGASNTLLTVRAKSSDEARSILMSHEYYKTHIIRRQLDNQKCASGKYLLGWNEYDYARYGGNYGIAAVFLHCGFSTTQEAISKGALDSGKTFYKWEIGDVSGDVGVVYNKHACEYRNGRWDERYGGNGDPDPNFCKLLSNQVPVLVDREPQEVIFILP
jgi:hypothetical protein